jgi:phosphatidylserine/phosphatidylglycerophosphate/cardiolipin synthase-like enzyme
MNENDVEQGPNPFLDATCNSKSFMHHKFAVVDDQLVINGSYNWTKGARFENKENLTLTNSPKAVQGFKGEFERLWAEFA